VENKKPRRVVPGPEGCLNSAKIGVEALAGLPTLNESDYSLDSPQGCSALLLLQQTEFICAADGCPAVIRPEFAVNVFGVRPQGVQRYAESAGNFRAAQVGSE
jgi:hypothetical protein